MLSLVIELLSWAIQQVLMNKLEFMITKCTIAVKCFLTLCPTCNSMAKVYIGWLILPLGHTLKVRMNIMHILLRDFVLTLWISKVLVSRLVLLTLLHFCRSRSSPSRAYQMPCHAMINITYGERKDMHRGHQPNTPCNAGQGPWKMNADQLDRRTAGHQQKERSTNSQSAGNFPVPQILSRPAQVGYWLDTASCYTDCFVSYPGCRVVSKEGWLDSWS